MSKTFDPHPYTCSFYYPHDSTLSTATASVTIKAPERGDRRAKGRNQTFAKLKNGSVAVYDMGTSMSDILSLSFEMVPQSEYAAMIVFFEYVVWGANKIKYIDYKGDEYVVRIYKNTVEATNQGEAVFGENELTQYNFTLDLIDVSNNIADTGQTAVPTQLALHIADLSHPHNPKTTSNVLSTDGAKVIESISVDNFKYATWIVVLSTGTFAKTVLVHATHNGTTSLDATTLNTSSQETIATVGTDPADITISVDLNGASTAQVMRLKVAKTAGNVDVSVRRIKI